MFGSSSPQAGGFLSRPADGDWNTLWVWLSQVRFGRCDYFIVIYVQRHVSINSDLHQALIWQTKGIGLPARLLQYQNEIPSTNKIQGMNGNITAVIFFPTQPLAPTLQLRPSQISRRFTLSSYQTTFAGLGPVSLTIQKRWNQSKTLTKYVNFVFRYRWRRKFTRTWRRKLWRRIQ